MKLMGRLLHFSGDPGITLFRPQLAATASDPEPLVWAIDEAHAPSYWFPRDCPRACCWVAAKPVSNAGLALLGPSATRLHAIEEGWLEPTRACRLYAYEFDAALFESRDAEAGYWVTRQAIAPLSVTPMGNLLARHAEAGIELRILGNLWPLIDAIVGSGLEFSIIRKANAQPRRV